MKYITYALLFFMCLSAGAAVAHYSLPEKARMSEEKAHNLLHKKYRVMGYQHSEEKK